MFDSTDGQRPSISSSSPSTTLTAASKLASPFPKLAYDATKAKQNGARPKTVVLLINFLRFNLFLIL